MTTTSEAGRPTPVERRGTRVIVVDESGAVLLLSANETLSDGSQRVIWFTPGGEAEGAETLPVAAVRELHEETGLLLAPERLSAAVACVVGCGAFAASTTPCGRPTSSSSYCAGTSCRPRSPRWSTSC